jgi:hypothetical protein
MPPFPAVNADKTYHPLGIFRAVDGLAPPARVDFFPFHFCGDILTRTPNNRNSNICTNGMLCARSQTQQLKHVDASVSCTLGTVVDSETGKVFARPNQLQGAVKFITDLLGGISVIIQRNKSSRQTLSQFHLLV